MNTEFMKQEDIKDLLRSEGLEPRAERDSYELIISKNVIRCKDGDTLIVGMGNDMKKDDQIHLVVDAVHLYFQDKSQKKNLKLIFGKRTDEDEQAEVENAVALMVKSIKIKDLKIEIEVDGKKVDFKYKSFDIAPKGKIGRWMKYLSCEVEMPEFAKDLEKAINDDLFKWYRSVTGQKWSGRVGGLEVCTIDLGGQCGELKVGRRGKNDDGPARKAFLEILEKGHFNEGSFSRTRMDEIASVIGITAESRRNGALNRFQREHLLESYVLSGKLKINSKAGVLRPAIEDIPFQFPTLWGPKGSPRFVDALMRCENIPYVIELKESSGNSRGQGFRHAITQAVLYREFIQKTEKVHPWFEKRGLKPLECIAVVAFPEFTNDDKTNNKKLLDQLILVGNAFGVEIVEIKDFTPKDCFRTSLYKTR
jgi:hypothetical protein